MPRLFFAVQTPELLLPEVTRMQEEIANAFSSLTPKLPFRKEQLENSHCTLTFLGDVDEPLVPKVIESVREIFERKPLQEFSINLTNVGVFTSRAKARVAWVGIGPVADLRLVKGRVDEGLRLAEIGFESNEEFHPHLTIARLKIPSRIPSTLDFPTPNGDLHGMISDVRLIESELTPAGAHHTVRARFELTRR